MVSKQTRFVLVGFAFLLLAVSFTLAATSPAAPQSITEVTETTFDADNWAPQSIEAVAGNITGITIDALGQTQAWQGYYGNISGTITLDDANNNTFYNWTSTEPRGEIFVTLNNSVTWSNVGCFNMTDSAEDNETTMDSYYGISINDADGIAETYNQTDHATFQIISTDITGCPTTYIHRDDAYQQTDFTNFLLYDSGNSPTGWIYGTEIEDTTGATTDLSCFNGQDCDFQIFVNEDGHGNDVATTTYYFWVELS